MVTYCLGQLSGHSSRAEKLQQRHYHPQNLKYLLNILLRQKLANSRSMQRKETIQKVLIISLRIIELSHQKQEKL